MLPYYFPHFYAVGPTRYVAQVRNFALILYDLIKNVFRLQSAAWRDLKSTNFAT